MHSILKIDYKINSKHIFYCPHWSSKDIKMPVKFEDSILVKKWSLEKNFVVQYSGNMGLWHDIDTIIHTANLLKEFKNIKFLMIGDGIKKHHAQTLSKRLNLQNIIWKPFVDYSLLDQSLAASHISIISLKESLKGVAVPSKLYGILASGRAILAQVPKKSEIHLTIKDHNCGEIVKTNSPQDLAEKIKNLYINKNRIKIYAENSFIVYKQKYTLSEAVKNIEKILIQ